MKREILTKKQMEYIVLIHNGCNTAYKIYKTTKENNYKNTHERLSNLEKNGVIRRLKAKSSTLHAIVEYEINHKALEESINTTKAYVGMLEELL